jgi:tRNA(His) guanylyltransferase
MPAPTAAIAGDRAEISKTQKEKERKRRSKAEIVVQHVDIIKDDFWNDRPWLLGSDAER